MPRTLADIDELLTRYQHGPAHLRDVITGLDAIALTSRPILGKLSSLEVLAHIVDSDQLMCDRMKRTIATERPLIMGVESIDYIKPLDYLSRDSELDLRLIEAQRQQMATDLQRLPAEAWDRTAVHSENGLVTLGDLLEHAVNHLESHAESIAQKRATLGV